MKQMNICQPMKSPKIFGKTLLFLACFFYFTSPWQRFFDQESKDGIIVFIGLIWAGVVFVYFIFKKNAKISSNLINNLIFIFLLLVISSLWSYDQSRSFSSLTRLTFFFALIICSSVSVRTKPDFDKLLFWYLFGIIVLNILLLNNYDSSVFRLSAFSLDPNGIAVNNLIGIAISFFCISRSNRIKIKITFLGVFTLLSYVLFLTGSRGGFIALLALFLVYSFMLIRKQPKSIIFIPCLIFVAIFVFQSIPEKNYERLISVTNARTISFAGRDIIFSNILSIIQEKPLTGIGYASFLTYNHDKFDMYQVAHNTFLEILVESGLIVFFILFAYLLFLLFKGFISTSEDYRTLFLLIVTVLLFSSLSLSSLLNKETWQILSLTSVLCKLGMENAKENRHQCDLAPKRGHQKE